MSVPKKTKFELAVVEKVTEMRTKRKLSQYDVAVILGIDKSFVGHVESPNHIAKYNLNHLNRLAAAFECSVKDFMPQKPIKEDFWDV